jgi:hypothetical protein
MTSKRALERYGAWVRQVIRKKTRSGGGTGWLRRALLGAVQRGVDPVLSPTED